MKRSFFIADTHFGHANVLKHDKRPFEDIKAHDKALIENWNRALNDDDECFILGDVSWLKPEQTVEILKKLRGKKHLIIGNHDKKLLKNDAFRNCFESIQDNLELKVPYNGRREMLVLSHYPIISFNHHFEGAVHFYGHVHNSDEWILTEEFRRLSEQRLNAPCRMFNVGVMMPVMNYTPRTFEEIINSQS